MASDNRPRLKAVVAAVVAALVVGSCAIASLFLDSLSFLPAWEWEAERPPTEFLQRRLLHTEDGDGPRRPAVYPWARNHALPLKTAPEPGKEAILFWHIPKSGGSAAKAYYRCLGKAVEVKSRPEDVLLLAEEGRVPSGQADIIFSSYPDFAIENLFDSSHRARVLAIFRHPVDRLVSKFYYLQVATWEGTYKPEWKGMDILEWAEKHNIDNNHMVKKLAGKVQLMEATYADLQFAKRTIQKRFVVGLLKDMAESIRRFDVVMGINNEKYKNHKVCRNQFFGEGIKVKNSNEHPKVEKGSPAWDLLAEKNSLDVQLYEYILNLYEHQRALVDSYESSVFASPVL